MEVRQQFAAERCRPCRAVQTAEAISHTDSARMKALGAATAGLQIRQCINAAATAQAQGDASGGLAINFSIGSSSSRSTSESSADSAQGSRVLAGGDIVFIAEGADKGARECSDILIRGSELSAGKTARLKVGYWNVAQQKAQGLEGSTQRPGCSMPRPCWTWASLASGCWLALARAAWMRSMR
jgi:hypothetical protein